MDAPAPALTVLQTLGHHAARIAVKRADGYVEITVDGNEVYGFTEGAIADEDNQAVLTFGVSCEAIAKAAPAIDAWIEEALGALRAGFAEIVDEVGQRKTSGNDEGWQDLDKVAGRIRDVIASAPTKAAAVPGALILENGATTETTWDQFTADNADCLDDADLQAIADTLASGDTYHGGGGAQPEWSIRRADAGAAA